MTPVEQAHTFIEDYDHVGMGPALRTACKIMRALLRQIETDARYLSMRTASLDEALAVIGCPGQLSFIEEGQ